MRAPAPPAQTVLTPMPRAAACNAAFPLRSSMQSTSQSQSDGMTCTAFSGVTKTVFTSMRQSGLMSRQRSLSTSAFARP